MMTITEYVEKVERINYNDFNTFPPFYKGKILSNYAEYLETFGIATN